MSLNKTYISMIKSSNASDFEKRLLLQLARDGVFRLGPWDFLFSCSESTLLEEMMTAAAQFASGSDLLPIAARMDMVEYYYIKMSNHMIVYIEADGEFDLSIFCTALDLRGWFLDLSKSFVEFIE